jgi:hypothetical protein
LHPLLEWPKSHLTGLAAVQRRSFNLFRMNGVVNASRL